MFSIVGNPASASMVCTKGTEVVTCSFEGWTTPYNNDDILVEGIKIEGVGRMVDELNIVLERPINSCKFNGVAKPAVENTCGCGIGAGWGCPCEGYWSGEAEGSWGGDTCNGLNLFWGYPEGKGLLGSAVYVRGTLAFYYEKRCPPLPSASDWTICIGKRQHRMTYWCNSTSNYDIVSRIEYRGCEECTFDEDCMNRYQDCYECINASCVKIEFPTVNCGVNGIQVHYPYPNCYDRCMNIFEYRCRKTGGGWVYGMCECPKDYEFVSDRGCVRGVIPAFLFRIPFKIVAIVALLLIAGSGIFYMVKKKW